jgi:hypothetical protein
MSRMKVPVIAITETAVREFESVIEAAKIYGISSPSLLVLINTGQLHRDKRTCFDYL